MRHRTKGFVYFITPEAVFSREESLRVVKIGFTRSSPIARMRDLQCGSPVTLELFAYIEGSIELERAFHEAFAPLRAQGEWFYIDHKLEDFLYYFADYHKREIDRLIPHDDVVSSVFDNVFAKCAPHPSITDEDYLASAEPRWLAGWYPEAVH